MTTAHAGGLPERWDAVLEHRDRAVRVARARLSDPYDVDDCVQEGMARVVAMPNLDLGRVGPLLSTVVANVAADTHRQHSRSSRLKAKVGGSQVPAPAGDEPICDAAEARWLRSRLDSLGHRERAVLEMRAEGHTVAQTAAALGMTYKAVESAFTRGRNTLKGLWRTTLVGIGALVGRAWRVPGRAAGAAVLAAAISVAVAGGHFVADPAPAGRPESAPPLPEPSFKDAADVTAGSRTAARGGVPARLAARHAIGPSDETTVSFRPPATYVRPPDLRATKERNDETFLQSLERCVKKGLTVKPEKIRCNA